MTPVIPSEVEKPRDITSCYHRGILRLRFVSLRMTRGRWPTDPTAAKHNVAIVNYRGLTWSDRALRLVQTNSGAIIFQRRHRRKSSGMIIADLDESFEGAAVADPGHGMPVHMIDLKFLA